MAENNSNLYAGEGDAIREILREYKSDAENVQIELAAQLSKLKDKINEQEKQKRKQILAEIAELEAKHIIDTSGKRKQQAQEQMVIEAAGRQEEADLLRQKQDFLQLEENSKKAQLTAELNLLQIMSSEHKRISDRENKILKARRDAAEAELKAEKADKKAEQAKKQENKDKQKAKAEDERKKAKALRRQAALMEKAADKDEKRKRIQAEDERYEFGDKLNEQFSAVETMAMHDPKIAIAMALEEAIGKALSGIGQTLTKGLNEISSAITTYASTQTAINARLQGISSYSKVVENLSSVAFSPLLNAELLQQNVATLVSEGIASNIEQRALLATVKDGIAETFDVTSASLNRIIRIQQNDSTAARLGMESYLTKFLNIYVENTEYLKSTFDSVADSLFEASVMLGQKAGPGASTEFEYVIQKWLGVLTGVGFSETSAQNLAKAFGELGSGDISNVGNNVQNLLIFAANKVNEDYAEKLAEGLDANSANKLMYGVVNYLQDIASDGNNIIKNQLAQIFGVTVSDLVAVLNLDKSKLDEVYSDLLSYNNMYEELGDQFRALPERLGISNIMENLFKNFTFQTGSNIAANPITYFMWKITDLIQSVTNGIPIPFVTALGTGMDFNATVENLMKLGIVGVSTLTNIGSLIKGAASGFDGKLLMDFIGINPDNAWISSLADEMDTTDLLGRRTTGKSQSKAKHVSTTESGAFEEQAVNEASDKGEKMLADRNEKTKNEVLEYLRDESQLKQSLISMGASLDYISIILGNTLGSFAYKDLVNSEEAFGTLASQIMESLETKYGENNFLGNYGKFSQSSFEEVLKERFPKSVESKIDNIINSINTNSKSINDYLNSINTNVTLLASKPQASGSLAQLINPEGSTSTISLIPEETLTSITAMDSNIKNIGDLLLAIKEKIGVTGTGSAKDKVLLSSSTGISNFQSYMQQAGDEYLNLTALTFAQASPRDMAWSEAHSGNYLLDPYTGAMTDPARGKELSNIQMDIDKNNTVKYLSDMGFSGGFKLLVTSVVKIAEKIVFNSSSSYMGDSIDGFTQYDF